MKNKYDELLDREIAKNKLELDNPSFQYDLYEEFVKNNVIIDVADLIDFDLCGFYIVYVSMHSTEDNDFLEIVEIVNNNIEKVIDLPFPIMKQVFQLAFSKEYGKEINKNNHLEKFMSLLIDINLKETIKLLRKIGEKKSSLLLAITKAVMEIKTNKEVFEEAFISWQIKYEENLTKKEKVEMFNEYLNERFKLNNLMSYIKEPINYAITYTKDYEKNRRNLNKELSNLLNAKKWMNENLIDGKYTNEVPISITKINNEEIKLKLLEIIYSHNKKYLDKISSEYNILSNNEKKLITSLLNKYGINYNNIDINFSYDNLKYILSNIEDINIKDPNLLINILKNTDMDTFNTIISYFKTGYITDKFIQKNYNIFNKNSNNYINLRKNISLLNNMNIGINDFNKASNILLFDNEIVSQNINILDMYNFTSCLNGLTNYNFLTKNNLNTKIDILIENGYEEYLKNNLYILNYDINNYKILYIIKELDSSNEISINKLLSNNDYFVNYNNIDEYIFNYLEYVDINDEDNILKINIITNLERKLISKNVYNIDGVLVSKNKVMSLLNDFNDNMTVKDVFNAITNKMVLKQEEITKIYKFITNKELVNENKKMVKI